MNRQRLAVLFLLLALGFARVAPAWADPRVKAWADQLKTSADSLVRTQAALGLGSSGDEAAVKPLCDALMDAHVAVRVAVAAALGKLNKPSGLLCLQKAALTEREPAAKAQMQKSIDACKSRSVEPPPPPPGPDAKYYVAIQVSHKTSRPAAEVEAIVRSAMQTKLLAKKGFAVAPKGETSAQGGQMVKSRKLKGFLLIVSVEAPVYSKGELAQVVRTTMWTYPENALQGEFAPKLAQKAAKGDLQAENLLMKLGAENVVDSFQKIVASL